MKKLILPLVMLALSFTSFGQIVRSTTFSKQETVKVKKEKTGYDIIGLNYAMDRFSYDYDGGHEPDPISANGFAFEYLHGFRVAKEMPMFIEFGFNINAAFSSQEDEKGETITKGQFASLSIPLNYAYRLDITDNFAIKPFIGLNFKLNILGRQRLDYSDEYMEKYGEYVSSQEGRWSDLYEKDEERNGGHAWNRFQLGWHIGVDFQFNKFFIGLNYGTDFISAYSYKKNKVNSQTLNLGLGFCF